MKFIGSKISRAKAMLAMGLVAGAISLAPGLANEAHAVQTLSPKQVEQESTNHQKLVQQNFVEETVQVHDLEHYGGTATINKLKALGIKTKMKTVKTLKPTKEHQKRINKTFEKIEQDRLRNDVDQLRQDVQGMSFRDRMNVHNPNSMYHVPDYDNISNNARITNSHITGNVRINGINDDRDTRY